VIIIYIIILVQNLSSFIGTSVNNELEQKCHKQHKKSSNKW